MLEALASLSWEKQRSQEQSSLLVLTEFTEFSRLNF